MGKIKEPHKRQAVQGGLLSRAVKVSEALSLRLKKVRTMEWWCHFEP